MTLNSNVIRRHRVSGGAHHQSGCSATRTATSPARPGAAHRVSGASRTENPSATIEPERQSRKRFGPDHEPEYE